MVLQKRLDYGFNGYRVPPTPRATRSARRRGSFKKRNEDTKLCAFDLLTIVAGKLLLGEQTPSSGSTSAEKDSCAVNNDLVKKIVQDEGKSSKVEAHHGQGSPSRSFFVSDPCRQIPDQNFGSKKSLNTQKHQNLGLASAITTSDCEVGLNAEKLENGKSKNEMQTFASKVGVGSSGYRKFGDSKSEGESGRRMEDELCHSGNLLKKTGTNMCSLEDPVVRDGKPPKRVSSDSSAKVLSHDHHIPHSFLPKNWDNVNVVSRDDDENSSGCTHPSTTKKFFRPAPRIGDRRIKKILASRYWKVAPRLKDVTVSDTTGDFKSGYRYRKNYYKYPRSEKIFPFKKRKHLNFCSPSNSDGGISSAFVSSCPQTCIDGDVSCSSIKMHGATGASSSIAGQHRSFQPRDSHVKLRIKSFRVPELFIEIPESATVGSLKRSVMDAVTAILRGRLCVGVFLQGKKIKDDNKTLLQTGISHNNQLGSVGFSLEPDSSQTRPLCPGDSSFLLPCDVPEPLSRYPPSPSVGHQGICAASPEHHMENVVNFVESDHDSAPFPTDMSIEKSTTNSKALVALPAINVEALAVVPPNRKSKRSEIVQRRIRRPFSVAEVEALVQAVEKLGTGRWRDVKLLAFDNAKHRTYVDLKDKWKTLVHTATISPQQRRGEPVPQVLLDRVLTAHAYWSQQQARQQLKPAAATAPRDLSSPLII